MSKEAMKLALEALEKITRHFGFKRLGESRLTDTQARGDAHEAITALREALAEQPAQQEPVKPFAWANTDDMCSDTAFRWCEIGDHKTPVYTSIPAQRKPLTDVIKAAQSVLEFTEIAHHPPKRDWLEVGRMVMVRLHALADLHDALTAYNIKEQPAPTKCWKCGDADPAFTDVCQVPACGMREQP